ncbi:carotenoid biosynthesis protein [Pedobacter sp. P351]|uniref:carotenoid biosynthesis protein n=1 Tax=Pedobacter superstes TaxID=3133441 RepID=UPI0030A14A53
MKVTPSHVCAFLVILFYGVGYFGFTDVNHFSLFKQLIPFHLLLMLVLMIISHADRDKYFWTFILITYVAGFIIELIGVKTGLIFGEYAYGAALGPKFEDIPWLIGVNWILVIYSAGMFLKELGIKSHVVRSLIGAFLITALDILIEPVAIKFDYWSWTRGVVPFQNYAGWFIFSFGMLYFFYWMKFRETNFAAAVLFIVQFAFFFALNMTTR